MPAPLPAHRHRLESFDDSTGPATPYSPVGDSTADLDTYLEAHDHDGLLHDAHPHSGVRAKTFFDRKTVLASAVFYVLGVVSASAIFLALR
jgi:hypothetical protein